MTQQITMFPQHLRLALQIRNQCVQEASSLLLCLAYQSRDKAYCRFFSSNIFAQYDASLDWPKDD